MSKKTALESKTDEGPVPGVQGKLYVGPGQVCGNQKAAPDSFSYEITKITGRRQVHIFVDAQERLFGGATIHTDPQGEGPG